MTPTQIIHSLCGAPRNADCVSLSRSCYVCGGDVARGCLVKDWMPSTFTDQNRVALPASPYICEGCMFVMAKTSPVPGRPPGVCKVCDGTLKVLHVPSKGKGSKAKIGEDCPKCEGRGTSELGGNFRNYSHLWEQDWEAPPCGEGVVLPGYVNASKGQKSIIREFLEREHQGQWFAAIANSGQKHVAPYTPINAAGKTGVVLFDEQVIHIPWNTSIIRTMSDMLTDGATKEEFERGDYTPGTWKRLGRTRIQDFEHYYGEYRDSWFFLALWLAQRDEEVVAARLLKEKREKSGRKGNKSAG